MIAITSLVKEFKYRAVRSSGSGGQHVNKVSTKVELSFNVLESYVLNESQKQRLQHKLQNKLTKEGVLILKCGESRSQLKNKTIVTNRAVQLVLSALKVDKKRIATKTPKSVNLKRLKSKRFKSERKKSRRRPSLDD